MEGDTDGLTVGRGGRTDGRTRAVVLTAFSRS